ncbi:hypothetical protein FB45DRAFT_770234 [Roridomyces roridus]|uniref:Galactose oxidase n=1 Tax=Roridomyces roridus TaxID=1738132 RepID=A0AAD7AY61_9AGAR|nr:hypothetical protein FB45DRAFT_770234 [Roridomyces roridus]
MSAAPHSTYDLTTFCRKTTGDVPPKLVGAATAVLGSEMYLFGGRLFAERRMVADLYVFDLETYNWQIIPAFPEDDVPCPRYFHSLETWNNHLILFGGMTDEPGSPDEYRVLNDIRLFDIESLHWLQPSRFRTPESLLPQARYAHLASVTADRLFIIGGQDYYNIWLTDVCVYDLITQTWSETRDHPVHCGSYRSIAVSSSQVVRFPEVELPDGRDSPVLCQGDLSSPSLVHLLYSAAPDNDYPSNIYLYSNRNFTQVKRELEVLSPLPNTGFTLQDLSSSFAGAQLPPGLRFPSGAIQGSHLIVSGIVIAKSDHAFSIWALDLKTMHWSHIDPGNALDVGSWVRGCLHADENKLIIFGNRAGNFVEDFTCRILSWDHVAVVDLEAFGIYQPPALKLDIHMQELGLAALNKRALADFDIICDDGRTLVCSRKLLEERRPWFKEMRLKLLQDAMSGLQVDSPTTDRGILDLRLTPRALHLPEQYPIAMALVQYFYTLALVTPLQTAPAVLSQLLILSTNYQLPHLQGLVRHAMHRALSYRTCTGVYEVATLCECRSLQIRAMRILMVSTRREEESPHSETAVAGEHSNHTYHIARIADNEAHAGPSTRPRSTARERRENRVFFPFNSVNSVLIVIRCL